MTNSRKIVAALLALLLALSLGGCGEFMLRDPARTIIRGNGKMSSDKNVNEFLLGQPHTLRIRDLNINYTSGKPGELTLVVDESLGYASYLETDSNIKASLDLSHDPRSYEIVLKGQAGMRYAPTKLTLRIGVPVTKLELDGVWNVTYDCPGVTNCDAVLSGAVNGDFAFGTLERLHLTNDGMGSVTLRGAAQLAVFSLSGAANINALDFTAQEAKVNIDGMGRCEISAEKNLTAAISGAASCEFALGAAELVDLNIDGTGNMKLRGAAQQARFRLSGAANILAFDLTAQDADVSMDGFGKCEITAEKTLRAEISGMGSIVYGGDPTVSKNIDGLGSVRKRA